MQLRQRRDRGDRQLSTATDRIDGDGECARSATGLAVTGSGGDVLFIEATAMPGNAGLTLTGQLGDVMKESAQIALSYLRSHAESFQLDVSGLDRSVHIHVPAGATPKDGPSAGLTMVTALASLATGRPVRSDVGIGLRRVRNPRDRPRTRRRAGQAASSLRPGT